MSEQNAPGGHPPKLNTLTKTIRQQVVVRQGLPAWYEATQTLYNQVVSFYFDLYQAYPKLLELSAQEALTEFERLTHRTAKNPQPYCPLDQAITSEIPAMLRRAAINQARGAYQSFQSNLSRWQRQKTTFESKPDKKGRPRIFGHRPPVPPRSYHFNPSFYAGMSKDRTDTSLMIKLWSGQAWQWVKLQIKAAPQVNAQCEWGSPILVERRGKFFLHTPIIWQNEKVLKLSEQMKDLSKVICSVDLNLDGCAAVCTILKSDGTPIATKFVHRGKGLDDRRKRLLGKVATKRSQTGIIAEGEEDNARTWQKIRDIDDNEAHRISCRIVEFAAEHGASVIVFEHLAKLIPTKDRYSRRSNAKRMYWLKGRIFNYTQYKAWNSRIIVSRVNPRHTSRLCPTCKQPLIRHRASETMVDYTPGTPLVICPSCLYRGNADRAAAINIAHKFLDRYYPGHFWPTTSEKPQNQKRAKRSEK